MLSSSPHSTFLFSSDSATSAVLPISERPATAMNETLPRYLLASLLTTGNSRRQMPHHSAQKIMNTGLDSWESVKVSLPSSPRARVKSEAGGPSGGGPGIVVSVASEVVVVPASTELRAADSDGVGSEFEVDGVCAGTAEVVVAVDDDCSLTTSGSIAPSEAFPYSVWTMSSVVVPPVEFTLPWNQE